jgi:hypothetical protein
VTRDSDPVLSAEDIDPEVFALLPPDIQARESAHVLNLPVF